MWYTYGAATVRSGNAGLRGSQIRCPEDRTAGAVTINVTE
jgi:hypothetical protein